MPFVWSEHQTVCLVDSLSDLSHYKDNSRQEVDVDSSSEELAHTFPPSVTKNVAGSFPQTQLNGLHQKDESGPDSTPPALPPKTRKTKVPEAPKEPEISDRGDSDMDEDTHSSNQDKQKSLKVVSEIVVIWFVLDFNVKDLLFVVRTFLMSCL